VKIAAAGRRVNDVDRGATREIHFSALPRFREKLLLGVGPTLGYAYLRLLRATMKLEHRNVEALDRARRVNGHYILAFWHSRVVMMPYGYLHGRLVALTSRHHDGRILAGVLRRFGMSIASGSSTGGGAQGLREVLRYVKQGFDVGITPDGPRGPRRRAKDGVVAVARISGLPIMPASFSANPAKRLASWDRTLLPRPFSKGLYIYGEPILVNRDASVDEQARALARLECELDRLTDLADREVGLPVEAPQSTVESR
jgi:lysophospholipid acyltransferase (LPLAT)-like uncharacterized protein